MASDGAKQGCIASIINPVKFFFFVINVIFFVPCAEHLAHTLCPVPLFEGVGRCVPVGTDDKIGRTAYTRGQIAGITALSLGGLALFDADRLLAFDALDETGESTNVNVSAFLKYLGMGMMGTGGALLFVGCLGCWGVAIGVSCCMYIYCLIFALMVAAQLAGFGYVYLQKDNIEAELKKTLRDAVNNFKGDSVVSAKEKAINLIQKYMHCCGVEGGHEYQSSPWYNSPNRKSGQLVPVTCCKLKDVTNDLPSDSQCQVTAIGDDNPYTQAGCLDIVQSYVFSVAFTGVIIWVVVMTLQLLALCYAAVIEKGFSDYDLAVTLTKGPSRRHSNVL